MSTNSFGLSDAKWESLQQGPRLMFALVAGSDSHVDRQELGYFQAALDQCVAAADQLTRAVVDSVATIEDLAASLSAVGDPLEGLRGVRSAAEGLADEGAGYRRALLHFGRLVADASGKQLTRSFAVGGGEASWRPASGISAHERWALEQAADALAVTHQPEADPAD
jgi:hypothetical protein